MLFINHCLNYAKAFALIRYEHELTAFEENLLRLRIAAELPSGGDVNIFTDETDAAEMWHEFYKEFTEEVTDMICNPEAYDPCERKLFLFDAIA